MDIEGFLSQALNLTGSYSPQVAIPLFLICFTSEAIGISIPLLLEGVWLLSGYQFSLGVLPFTHLVLLVLTAQAGRQSGAFLLFNLSRGGSILVTRLFKYFKLSPATAVTGPAKLFKRIDLLSPFSVATGRFLWMRIPLTLVLGLRRQLRVLSLGVLIQSLIWDGVYVTFGAAVGPAVIVRPIYVLPFFLGVLAVIYAVTFVARRIYQKV